MLSVILSPVWHDKEPRVVIRLVPERIRAWDSRDDVDAAGGSGS